VVNRCDYGTDDADRTNDGERGTNASDERTDEQRDRECRDEPGPRGHAAF
jgi:hypothetical protein